MSAPPISEQDLHAYADGRLDAGRREEVESWLEARPEMAQRVGDWRHQNAILHAAFDAVAEEPIPARLMQAARPRWRAQRMAALVAWMAVGATIGFVGRGWMAPSSPTAMASLPRQAAVAHAVFSPEVRHPVEVGADQEAHLVKWLSKRLGSEMRAPRLQGHGFELVGGRLLAGDSGPVAQLMYQDTRGQRLTLFVRTDAQEHAETAFRFAQEGQVGVFYWLDGRLGYALSGEIGRDELLAVATTVYRQINP